MELTHVICIIGCELKRLFWNAAKSSTPQGFELVMREIKKINKEAHAWIRRHDPKLWSRGFFQTLSKCESVDNNLCECFNGTILDARYKPIIDMLEDIRHGVNDRMQRRRKAMEKWVGDFCPRIIDMLDRNIAAQRNFCTTYHGGFTYEVKMDMVGYIVDIEKRSCTCRMWELSGVPCSHAVSAIYAIRANPRNYIDSSLSVEKCKAAYAECISALNGKNMWEIDETDPILPPPHRRMPGRPKKARRKGANEETKRSGDVVKLSTAGFNVTCANCFQSGHNKRTCKNPTVHRPKVVSNCAYMNHSLSFI